MSTIQPHLSEFPHLNWSSWSRLNPFPPPPPPNRSVEFDCDVITEDDDDDELLVAATAANVDAADAMEEEVRMELAAVDTADAEAGLSERMG